MSFIKNLQNKPLKTRKNIFITTLFLFGILMISLSVITIVSTLPNVKLAGQAISNVGYSSEIKSIINQAKNYISDIKQAFK